MKNSVRSSTPAVIYILAFAAFVLVSIGAGFTFSTYQFSKYSLETTGRVIGVSTSYRDGVLFYHPTISFIDFDGIKRSGQTYRASRTYNFGTGDEVNILVDVRDPQSFRVNDRFGLWGPGYILLGSGLALAAILRVLLWRRRGSARISRRMKPRKASITAKHIIAHKSTPSARPSVVRRMR